MSQYLTVKPPMESFVLLDIFDKKVNSYYNRELDAYRVFIFTEFKQIMYLPFRYTDNLKIIPDCAASYSNG